MVSNSSIFVDSGAHSIYTREIIKKGFRADNYGFYETDEFWKYVDDYAEFIKKNKDVIDTYVNIDVIFNNEMSWKVQRYLEDEHGLNPLPVLHPDNDMPKWLRKYLDNYDYIGIGGLGQQSSKAQWIVRMGDPVFSLICNKPDYLPTHKIHGFAITSPELLANYPWYSVDSTSWIQFGKYGVLIVPRKKNGSYRYDLPPFLTFITSREKKHGDINHFNNLTSINKHFFNEYFKEKGFIIGKSEFKTIDPAGYKLQENEQWADRKAGLVEIILEKGLCNSHELRDRLNLQFYLDLEATIPPWPNPWTKKVKLARLF